MKPIFLLYYAVAAFLPLILFLEVFDNLNERQPLLVFVVTLPLWFVAGVLSSAPGADRWKWVGWSLLFGVIEACLLAFAF
jgi:cell division protein FtsW (lipid II flippase)